jgi:hypothetical protein
LKVGSAEERLNLIAQVIAEADGELYNYLWLNFICYVT